jgi:hypothetical protein
MVLVNQSAQRRKGDAAFGKPRHSESATMADRNLSGVSRDQLQVYLDEFVFRHNRRRHPMAAFQTLLGLGTGHKSTAYQRIRAAQTFPTSTFSN